MFYFLWHGEHGTGLYDNTQLLAADPNNPQWGPEEYDFSAFGALLSAGIYDFGPNPTSSLSFYMIAARALVDGDFNMDFDVDAADLALWQASLGIQSGATRGQGDADGDTDVDGNDFLIWQLNFTGSGGGLSASTAVPEPSTALLLCALICAAATKGAARGCKKSTNDSMQNVCDWVG
jgi:hypothetical protein